MEYLGQRCVRNSGEARRGVKEQVNGGAVQNTERYKEALGGSRHYMGTWDSSSIIQHGQGWARLGSSVGGKPGLLDTNLATSVNSTGEDWCAKSAWLSWKETGKTGQAGTGGQALQGFTIQGSEGYICSSMMCCEE